MDAVSHMTVTPEYISLTAVSPSDDHVPLINIFSTRPLFHVISL